LHFVNFIFLVSLYHSGKDLVVDLLELITHLVLLEVFKDFIKFSMAYYSHTRHLTGSVCVRGP